MVKKIAAACLLMAFGSTLHAADITESSTFIGLELESTKSESSLQLGDTPKVNFESDSVLEYGLRFGAENDEWRTTLLYTYYNDEDNGAEETMHKGSVLLDYFFWKTDMDTMSIKPYLGAHVGYMTYELTDDQIFPGFNTTISDGSGVFYGLQAGINMIVSEVVGFDISYKYSWTGVDDSPLPDSTFKLDNMGSIAFSVSYYY